MKSGLLFTCILFRFLLYGQNISSGWVYGGVGQQESHQCFVDKIGNRYQVITTLLSSCTIDSLGTPIHILHDTNDPSDLIIAKFDSTGKYLYHLRIIDRTGSWFFGISLGFSASNEVYFHSKVRVSDTVSLYNSNGTLFKRLTNSSISNYPGNYASMVGKIDTFGRFVWVNTISWKDSQETTLEELGSISVFDNNEFSIPFYRRISFANETRPDTIVVSNNTGLTSLWPVIKNREILRFQDNGTVKKVTQPFKFCLPNLLQDTLSSPFGNTAISDGINTYLITEITVQSTDTFHSQTNEVLKPGHNVLLLKLDMNDSVIWARSIGLLPNPRTAGDFKSILSFDSVKKEIIVGISYMPNEFRFSHTTAYNSSRTDVDIILLRINATNGNIVSENNFSGSQHDWLSFLLYNPISKQIVIAGETFSNDLQFGSFIIQNSSPSLAKRIFIAFQDTSSKWVSLQTISNTSPSNSYRARFPYFTFYQYPQTSYVIDRKGRIYISGAFGDTINLKCKQLGAYFEYNQFGNRTSDAFVLAIDPIISKDTIVCNSIKSPSGLYTWDTSGYYFDTLSAVSGCDSVALYHLIQKRSKNNLDSSVCDTMRSMSGKYLWSASGTYKDTIQNAYGCDSLITVNLSVLKSYKMLDSSVKYAMISHSGKYKWDSSGTYYDTIVNSFGCDSLLTIKLIVLSSTGKIDSSVCRQMISPSGKYTYTTSGSYLDTILNKNGGDSIVSIQVHIRGTSSQIDTSYCGALNSPSGKYIWSTPGTYQDTILNVHNCDSIITVNFSRGKIIDTLHVQKCTSYTSPSGRYVYSVDGFYIDTLSTPNMCDSIFYIYYKSLASASTVNISACDSAASPSAKFMYYLTGTYSDTVTNHLGCDSVIRVQVLIEPVKPQIKKVMILPVQIGYVN